MKDTIEVPYLVGKREYFKFTRLVDETGTYHNSYSVWDARIKAETLGLQLVCFNLPDKNAMAFCKIIDFGKWKYDQEKALKKQKANKHGVKEVCFTPNIEANDISHKIKRVSEFIHDGYEVILNMKVEGRDRGHMDIVASKMTTILSKCEEFSKLLSRKDDNGNIIVRVGKK